MWIHIIGIGLILITAFTAADVPDGEIFFSLPLFSFWCSLPLIIINYLSKKQVKLIRNVNIVITALILISSLIVYTTLLFDEVDAQVGLMVCLFPVIQLFFSAFILGVAYIYLASIPKFPMSQQKKNKPPTSHT